MKKTIRFTVYVAALVIFVILGVRLFRQETKNATQVGLAVEFNNHAAAAYVAKSKGWYASRGVNLSFYKSYVTGMTLASALARRDIQVAYMCLAPAINAYSNAHVPIRIVAGTHKYGYALVANPRVLTTVRDLVEQRVRVGCVREGGAADLVMNRLIDRFELDRKTMLDKVLRMNPPKLLIAIQAGRLDAAILPEQWASMAEDLGFRMVISAKDIWPGMQGSVLVVKEELIRERPELVASLININYDATVWINSNFERAAETVSRMLSITGNNGFSAEFATVLPRPAIDPKTMLRSMRRLHYTTAFSAADVQPVIAYAAKLGYIKRSFAAEDIIETRFVR